MNKEKQLQLYQDFIINCTTNAKSVKNYSDFKRINECLELLLPQQQGISILDYDDPVEFKDVINKLTKQKQFVDYDTKGGNQYSNTLKHYLRFLYAKKMFLNVPADKEKNEVNDLALQQIFYGAPGTGKSHRIKDDAGVKAADEKNLVFRTTFHPDSDYSTFVGAYKPTMDKKAVRNVAGDIVKNTDKEEVYEECITYAFVPQAFLQAYVAAWNNQDENVYLIIEEINRGNCAQIFGDLFQLLDRDCDGYSEYPIMADKDLAKYLNGKDENGRDILINKDGIKDGKLRLPKNLYIWATMNTSDQSLFPIDSAFKRRWEWKYIPICDAGKAWKICVSGTEYDWWSFVENINNKIWDATHSEDKKLGYFFCKADRKVNEDDVENNVISADRFVGKVLFYVYNDVFRDYGFDDAIFKDKEDNNSDLSFQCFFKANGKPNEEKIEVFLKNLDVKLASEVEEKSDNDDFEETEEVDEEVDENELNDNGVSDTNSPYRVTFPDGEVICEEHGWDTYIAALRKIGLDKALPFGQIFTRNNKTLPLITDKKIPDQGSYKYIKIDGYYVLSGTDSQHRLLKRMNKDLGLGLIIE